MLVDDDAAVLQALAPMLKGMGHDVLTAQTGEAALDGIYAQNGVELLITDVVMDPLDGLTLSDHLHTQYAGIRTIFITGYDLSDYASRIGATQLLQKPISLEALTTAVEKEHASLRGGTGSGPLKAVPKAVPVPGQHAARPQAMPTVAAPKAVAVAKGAPAAVAKPVARPTIQTRQPVPASPGARITMPTGQPGARATRVMPAAPTPMPASGPVPTADGQATGGTETSAGLMGQMIGGYQIVSQISQGKWGTLYAAVQTAINRPVGLKVLDPSCARDDMQKQRFIADARAKAHVQHPSILSVYEAGAADGWIFYTHEYVDGQNMAEMYSSGRKVDETTALKVLRVAAEGLLYLNRNDVPHAALQSSDVFLGIDGHPRLSNLATQFADEQLSVEQEIEVLGQAVWPVLTQPVSHGLHSLLSRTQQSSPNPINAWGALLQGVKALEPKIVPVEAEKISAQERAAAASAEKARQAQRRALYLNALSMGSVVILAAWAVWYFALRSNERLLDDQVHIPAGDFIAGNGQTVKGQEFWIDKYEVTIGQYAKFVQWIQQHPGDEHAYDHPRQPKQQSHVPEHWDIYYGQAAAGRAAHKTPISLNSPVMTVTWWDAYAFAKWKDRDLPTELEWERAARGTDGRAYPWGDEADAKKANTNADYQPADPGAPGKADGFNFWGDVDAQKTDKSPDGTMGMAGNVSEWTATWTPDNTKPILKGGNFSLPLTKLSDRMPTEPGKAEEFIGFRTVSHKAPDKH